MTYIPRDKEELKELRGKLMSQEKEQSRLQLKREIEKASISNQFKSPPAQKTSLAVEQEIVDEDEMSM